MRERLDGRRRMIIALLHGVAITQVLGHRTVEMCARVVSCFLCGLCIRQLKSKAHVGGGGWHRGDGINKRGHCHSCWGAGTVRKRKRIGHARHTRRPAAVAALPPLSRRCRPPPHPPRRPNPAHPTTAHAPTTAPPHAPGSPPLPRHLVCAHGHQWSCPPPPRPVHRCPRVGGGAGRTARGAPPRPPLAVAALAAARQTTADGATGAAFVAEAGNGINGGGRHPRRRHNKTERKKRGRSAVWDTDVAGAPTPPPPLAAAARPQRRPTARVADGPAAAPPRYGRGGAARPPPPRVGDAGSGTRGGGSARPRPTMLDGSRRGATEQGSGGRRRRGHRHRASAERPPARQPPTIPTEARAGGGGPAGGAAATATRSTRPLRCGSAAMTAVLHLRPSGTHMRGSLGRSAAHRENPRLLLIRLSRPADEDISHATRTIGCAPWTRLIGDKDNDRDVGLLERAALREKNCRSQPVRSVGYFLNAPIT